MIKVVLFTAAYDTGGQGYRIKQSFDKYMPDEFEVRSIHSMDTYFHYPSDFRSKRPAATFELMADADVLHMRNSLGGSERAIAIGGAEDRPPKGLVLHHHGTAFRDFHEITASRARAAGAVQIASTIDLTLLEPDVEWVPSPIDVDAIAYYKLPPLPNEKRPIRIAHAPTNKIVKSTDKVIEAVKDLQGRGYSVELDLIERQTWAECLARKSRADIYVDQLNLGIGNNALESWALGIPVVAGVREPHVRQAMLDRWGSLPFYEADSNGKNLADCLAELIVAPELRVEWATRGKVYLVYFHHPSKVVAQLAGTYRKSLAIANSHLETT